MNFRSFALAVSLFLFKSSYVFAALPFVGDILNSTDDDISFSNPNDVLITHVDLNLKINFQHKEILGTASLSIKKVNPKATEIILDTDLLNILEVRTISVSGNARQAKFSLKAPVEFKGSALHVPIDVDTTRIDIRYSTSPEAPGIIWTPATETFGGLQPYMFTMGEPNHTRSWFPVQDTPQVRMTFNAHVQVPLGIKAVMSGLNPHSNRDTGAYDFTMSRPVPAYLIALAAGDLIYQSTGPRSGVFAEPGLINLAAKQFSDSEEMIQAAESIFGPYQWDDFNLLILPPSASAGGMENPSLIYFHSMYLDGTSSYNYIVAHELAHFWTSNLVGNATWEDFWLNEGMATYGQRRITEKLYGAEFSLNDAYQRSARLHSFIDRQRGKSEDRTVLSTDLMGKDPSRYLNILPYEKSYLLLLLIEQTTGREKFDRFLNGIFSRRAFSSIRTQDFIDEIHGAVLTGLFDENEIEALGLNEWLYKPGLPANAPSIISTFAGTVQGVVARWLSGLSDFSELKTSNWTALEYNVLIATLPAQLSKEQVLDLETTFHLSSLLSSPVLMAWLQKLIVYDFDNASTKLQYFLKHSLMGRAKPVELATMLCVNESGWKLAKEVYDQLHTNYSPSVAQAYLKLLNDTNPSE